MKKISARKYPIFRDMEDQENEGVEMDDPPHDVFATLPKLGFFG